MLPRGLAALELNWHVPHLSTASRMSSLIPGQNTDSWTSAYIFQLLGVLHVSVAGLSFLVWRYQNPVAFGCNAVFNGHVFSVVPIVM